MFVLTVFIYGDIMDKNLLSLKKKLKFNENGKFKILTISDIHGGPNYSPQLPVAMKAIVESVKPDLVLLGGDTGGLHGVHLETKEDLKILLDACCEPMEKNGIPWAHVFGNHDDNYGLSIEEQEEVYESFPCCVSKWGQKDLDGVGNYVLPVFSHDESTVLFNVWGMDSHKNVHDLKKSCNLPEETRIVYPVHFNFGRDYSMPSTNQVFWYYKTSAEFEQYFGRKIPGLMYMHIPIPEMYIISQNREECKFCGTNREDVGCGEYNTGLFSACLERGDVKTLAFGHDHINDWTGEYCGVTFAYMGSVTYDCYQDDDLRGGRVFEVDENGNVETYMVRIRDLLGADGDRKEPPRGV